MHAPLEALHHRFRDAGVTPRRARRLVDELDDHINAAVATGRSREFATSQLGHPDDLVAAVTADPRNLCAARRWPRLVFGLTPPMLVLASIPVGAFLVVGAVRLAEHFASPGLDPEHTIALAERTRVVARSIVACGIVLLYAWLGHRARCRPIGPLVAGCAAAVLSSLIVTGVGHDPTTSSSTPFTYFADLSVRPLFGGMLLPRTEIAVAASTAACLLLAAVTLHRRAPRAAQPD